MLKNLCLALFIFCFSILCAAQDTAASSATVATSDISLREKKINFGAVYVSQWIYYGIAHRNEIKKYGSFDNWVNYSIDPHYDRDGFEFNLLRHTFAGYYYYLFYRSRGYTEENAFIWTYLSSLVFEFTIETITERPSYQDLYQTPVFGTVMGVGAEKLAKYLHSTNTWAGHTAGYILNPFVLLPTTNSVFGYVLPENDKVSLMLQMEFQ